MDSLNPDTTGLRSRQTQSSSSTSTPGVSLPTDLLNLQSALLHIRSNPPRQIASPPTQQGRASVAICIRLVPSPLTSSSSSRTEEQDLPKSIDAFFAQDWVKDEGVRVEIMYIRRAKRPSDRWSSQLAFPGGRSQLEDDDALFTALRETWEEVGIDLAESNWLNVGRLDDREITTSLGKRLLMVLSPFVFLQTSRSSPLPELDASEVATLHWIPLDYLMPQSDVSTLSSISISLAPRLSPRNALIRRFIHLFVGSMRFTAIALPDEPSAMADGYEKGSDLPEVEAGGDHPNWLSLAFGQPSVPGLRLWGLTLGMTLDLISLLLVSPSASPSTSSSSSSSVPILSSSSPDPAPLSETSSSSPHPSPTQELNRPLPVTVSSSFEQDTFPGGYPKPPKEVQRVKAGMGRRSSLGGLGSRKPSGKKQPLTSSAEEVVKRPGRSLNAGTVSVLPVFSFADVNFLVWVFGRRYRAIIRAWDESVDHPNATSQRINWSGASLSAFYSSVRKALVVAIIVRAVASIVMLGALLYWLYSRSQRG